ncbi:alanine racemase [Fulvivirga sedimenti]|uniref:Alanine racemase n=1 Tax=Fulvivirga sedimenti TaxID=2879465 RepID=A0A9X1HXV3_9BACT|nr:alanine racemase [Fulvivirga sedimenti]MCA6078732.1 alanine racemase [Fulvivirga sedimenti]
MSKTSVIKLSQQALQNNIDFLKTHMGDVKISSVVKGNAYGHSIRHFVPMAEECGIEHFSVFSGDEAREVKSVSGRNTDVMIMGFMTDEDIEWAVQQEVSFFVFEMGRVRKAIIAAQNSGKLAKIHIELETGFNRTGFEEHMLEALADILVTHKSHVTIEGVCTHFAGAESVANHVRVTRQLAQFHRLTALLKEMGINAQIHHTACSAASMIYPETRMDMVRIGILQYGFWPGKEVFIDFLAKQENQEDKRDPLKRVLTWRSSVMAVKSVKTGEFVGYGTSYLAEQDIRVATIPVGYAHGYSRALSNQGRVLIRDHRLGIIGIINMNASMVDVSELDEVYPGDEVTLIGGAGDKEISVSSFGELSNQLNYELLTRLPHSIERIVVK